MSLNKEYKIEYKTLLLKLFLMKGTFENLVKAINVYYRNVKMYTYVYMQGGEK